MCKQRYRSPEYCVAFCVCVYFPSPLVHLDVESFVPSPREPCPLLLGLRNVVFVYSILVYLV